MNDHNWESAHLYYHANLDPLLVDLVAPLVASLASDGLVDGFFFLRYWDGGNHLRLRLRCCPQASERVRRQVADYSEEFFNRRPAAQTLEQREYAKLARQMARLENVDQFQQRQHPNNSIAFVAYHREYDRFGGAAAIEAVEQHFVESSWMALQLATNRLPSRKRDTTAVAMIILSWLRANPGDRQLARYAMAPPEVTDATGRYRRQEQILMHIVSRVRDIAAGGSAGSTGVLSSWWRSLDRLCRRLAGGHHINGIVDTCAHLLCNRLGVTVGEERYLRYLSARALLTSRDEGALR